MGFKDILAKIGLVKTHEVPVELDKSTLPPGISQKFYSDFAASCRESVESIRDARQWVLSRDLRNQSEQVCELVLRVAVRCEEDPANIFYARDLPIVLRFVPTMLRDSGSIDANTIGNRSPEVIKIKNSLTELVQAIKQIEHDITGGVISNLEAHNRTLANIIQRHMSTFPELKTLPGEEQNAEHSAR